MKYYLLMWLSYDKSHLHVYIVYNLISYSTITVIELESNEIYKYNMHMKCINKKNVFFFVSKKFLFLIL